ncbi:hypothetical protein [Pseudomonas sp. LS-2]|uniref:hypothetical protein n=1 Tax=Pseudomonas sp. LS-2 TaxID=2315859 RepID=UPI000E745F79|nr:hypothetical protein [Pseudomonas sp. LS-2]RJX82269.1 hypothetical protein D3M70_06755 [Pseudomonas sp. LS-2]
MTMSPLAQLSTLELPPEVYEQAAQTLHQIHTSFAPFQANLGFAQGNGLVMGLVAAKAHSVQQGQVLLDVFKRAERLKLDELAESAARNPHAPVLMNEKAAFSAFHFRMTKKEVEAQPKSGSYNDGWTTGAHEAWFARADLARAAARQVDGTVQSS